MVVNSLCILMKNSKEYTGFARFGTLGKWMGRYCGGIALETNIDRVVVPVWNISPELKNNSHMKGICLLVKWIIGQ